MGAPRVTIDGDDVDACWPQLDDMVGAQEYISSFEAGASMNPELYR